MYKYKITDDRIETIINMLIIHCGCHELVEDTHYSLRDKFVDFMNEYLQEDGMYGYGFREWTAYGDKIGGSFKIWLTDERVFITVYRECETPEKLALVKLINTRIKELIEVD